MKILTGPAGPAGQHPRLVTARNTFLRSSLLDHYPHEVVTLFFAARVICVLCLLNYAFLNTKASLCHRLFTIVQSAQPRPASRRLRERLLTLSINSTDPPFAYGKRQRLSRATMLLHNA